MPKDPNVLSELEPAVPFIRSIAAFAVFLVKTAKSPDYITFGDRSIPSPKSEVFSAATLEERLDDCYGVADAFLRKLASDLGGAYVDGKLESL